MASNGQWEMFSDDEDDGGGETLSLCDLPVVRRSPPAPPEELQERLPEALEDFEFRTCGKGASLKEPDAAAAGMCAADDIFFRGQLLPSFNYTSRGGTRSSSSNSLSSGSGSISRSHSSSSGASSADSSTAVPPRLSVSNKFYAAPSPRPQVVRASAARRSTGSGPPGWAAAFRLGVVRAPEIEVGELLRSRRLKSGEVKAVHSGTKPGPTKMFGFAYGFGCRCAPDVAEPASMASSPARPLIPKTRSKRTAGIGSESRVKSDRVFEWLEELPSVKKSVVG